MKNKVNNQRRNKTLYVKIPFKSQLLTLQFAVIKVLLPLSTNRKKSFNLKEKLDIIKKTDTDDLSCQYKIVRVQ